MNLSSNGSQALRLRITRAIANLAIGANTFERWPDAPGERPPGRLSVRMRRQAPGINIPSTASPITAAVIQPNTRIGPFAR